MKSGVRIFRDSFDFESGIEQAKSNGYFFADGALTVEMRSAMETEIDSLPLEVGDHIVKPINEGKPNEVRQQHERFYVEYGDKRTPVANLVIDGLADQVHLMANLPELSEWQLSEIGYQRYRHSNDFIGAHRDRASDKLLSATFTITGSATVRIFEPLGDHWDYSNIRQIDEFDTTTGSLMLLRAPGLGNGGQVIHQVLPPRNMRSILNLRARPTILEQPIS